MPELAIDLTPLLRIEGAFERIERGDMPSTQRVLRAVGVNLFNAWRAKAADTPGVYRKPDYLDGLHSGSSIRDPENAIGVDIVHTRPDVAKGVHKGVPAHDMKPYLVGTLRGQPRPSSPGQTGNAREIMKDGHVVGRVNFIPLRQKVSGIGGGAAKEFRAIRPTEAIEGGGTKWGGRVSEKDVDRISKRPEMRRAFEALVKARAARRMSEPSFDDFKKRFVGMVREETRYAKATQSTYKTFRAVSIRTDGKGSDGKGSDAGSWRFPGWSGVDFPREVVRDNASQIRGAILDGLAADFGKV